MGKKSRAGKKSKPKKFDHYVESFMDEMKSDIEKEYAKYMLPVAVQEAFMLMLSISCVVLHDYYKFGKKRMGDFAEHVLDYFDSIQTRYVTIDEVADEFTRMTGLRYALTAEDSDTLSAFGMQGLIEELQMQEKQKQYWADRRAQGWLSNENRYGQIVR